MGTRSLAPYLQGPWEAIPVVVILAVVDRVEVTRVEVTRVEVTRVETVPAVGNPAPATGGNHEEIPAVQGLYAD